VLRLTYQSSMVATVVLLVSGYTFAANPDRFQTNRDIHVDASDKPTDVTCFHCSIFVRGEVNGDLTAIGGNITLEDGAQVHGDITAVVGDIRLEANTMTERDVTAVVGTVRRDPQAAVKGDVTAIEGRGWLILVVVLPLALVGGLLALLGWIVFWLIRRNHPGVPVAA
jgi:hypothetical protein